MREESKKNFCDLEIGDRVWRFSPTVGVVGSTIISLHYNIISTEDHYVNWSFIGKYYENDWHKTISTSQDCAFSTNKEDILNCDLYKKYTYKGGQG
jgi:hypothetical protein